MVYELSWRALVAHGAGQHWPVAWTTSAHVGRTSKGEMKYLLLTIVFTACGAESSRTIDRAPRLNDRPKIPRQRATRSVDALDQWKGGVPRLLTAAGPHIDPEYSDETGSAWAIEWPWAAWVKRGIYSTDPETGVRERVPHCSATGPILWARSDQPHLPTEWNSAADGRIPPGEQILHIKMTRDLCLVALRFPQPVTAFRSHWIMVGTGVVTEMAKCGDSPDSIAGQPCAVANMRVQIEP